MKRKRVYVEDSPVPMKKLKLMDMENLLSPFENESNESPEKNFELKEMKEIEGVSPTNFRLPSISSILPQTPNNIVKEVYITSFSSHAHLSIKNSSGLVDVRPDKIFKLIVSFSKNYRTYNFNNFPMMNFMPGDGCLVEYVGIDYKRLGETTWKRSLCENFITEKKIASSKNILELAFKLPKSQKKVCRNTYLNICRLLIRLHTIPPGMTKGDYLMNPYGTFVDICFHFQYSNKKAGEKFQKVKFIGMNNKGLEVLQKNISNNFYMYQQSR